MERRQLQVMQWHAYWMRPAKAEALLRGGGWLAKQYDARLAIIHVVAPASAKLDYVVYERDVVTSANMRMRELKGRQGIYAPHRVAGGMIAAMVQEEAQRQADPIVTGRGRRTMDSQESGLLFTKSSVKLPALC